MIGILGGMGTQAGLDFCNKLVKINKVKTDQQYPLFVLYNKSNIPNRTENINRYNKVLKSLLDGCKFLEKNKCKFIVIPCNTAHYWFDDLQKKTKIPIISMPREVYVSALKTCKKNSKIALLATEGTLKTRVYNKLFDKKYELVNPGKSIQAKNVDKAIKFVKMGQIIEAGKAIKPAVNFLIKNKCKKIILGCTELPIAVFTSGSFKKVQLSKNFLDPNMILAEAAMQRVLK